MESFWENKKQGEKMGKQKWGNGDKKRGWAA